MDDSSDPVWFADGRRLVIAVASCHDPAIGIVDVVARTTRLLTHPCPALTVR